MKKTIIITICILLSIISNAQTRTFSPYVPEINAEMYGKILMKHEEQYRTNIERINAKREIIKDMLDDLYELNHDDYIEWGTAFNNMFRKWNKQNLDYGDDNIYSQVIDRLDEFKRRLRGLIKYYNTK